MPGYATTKDGIIQFAAAVAFACFVISIALLVVTGNLEP
jgi:hypothetical protein